MKNSVWYVRRFRLSLTLICLGHNCIFSEFSRSFKQRPAVFIRLPTECGINLYTVIK